MSSKSGFKILLPVILLVALFLLGTQFMVNSLGSLDQNSNVSSAYQGQYNDTRDTSITTLSITKELPLVLGAFAIICVLLVVIKRKF